MASLALGVVGGVIGSFVGMPHLGFLLGSALGSYIDQQNNKQHQEGPRLQDRRVQTSTYGQMIPIVRGTMGVAGNVIWATDLEEESSTEDVGGKGGPSAEVTQYSYFANFAVSLCEGPIESVRRIWANGRLWYDASADNQGYTGWRLYTGTETQLPDPTIESFKGVGNVPAYRGQAYVVLRHLPVGPFGNMIPQLFFEVCESSTVSFQIQTLSSKVPDAVVDPRFSVFGSDGALWQSYVVSGDGVYRVDPYTGQKLSTWGMGAQLGAGGGSLLLSPISGGRFWGAQSDRLMLIDPRARTAKQVYKFNLPAIPANMSTEPGAMATLADDLFCIIRGVGTDIRHAIRVTIDPTTGDPRIVLDNPFVITGTTTPNIFVPNQTLASFTDTTHWALAYGACDGQFYYAFAISITRQSPLFDSGPYRIYRYRCDNLQLVDFVDGPTTPTSSVGWTMLLHDGYLYVSARSRIDKWDPATMTRVAFVSGGLQQTPDARWLMLTEDNKLLISGGTTITFAGGVQGNAFMVDPLNFDASSVVRVLLPPQYGNFPPYSTYGLGPHARDPITGRVIGVSWQSPAATVYRLRTGLIDSHTVPLSQVVAGYLDRVGVEPAQYNVSALASTFLRGTVLARQCSARQAIEPLASAYLFDGIESGPIIKFVLRGGSVVATVPDDDLADAGQDVPRLGIQRAQDVDLPRTVNINHFEPDRDYQEGTQYARRFGGFSESDMSVEVPVSLVANEAKGIAETWLYNAWVERLRFSFATGPKYNALEPTDLIELHGFVIRLTKRVEDGLLLRWDGVNDASQIYLQDAAGAEGSGAGDQVPPGSQTAEVLYLDIPLLRDSDDAAGFYLAANGVPTAGWPGAQIYKSLDAGLTFAPYYAITVPSTFGFTTTALANWQTKLNIFDEINTVDVSLNGALSSATELAVLNGANHILLGREVVQFKIATLIGTNAYRLSGLLRGRLGTEWANGLHVASERAVLLNANLRNASHATSELNQARVYDAVTFGYPLEVATRTTFTNTGVRHECYAPVDLGGGRQSNNDWIINWKRRTRLSDGWINFVDAPLGETSESYEVEIMQGATLKRTLISSTPTVTYTSAQQVADFGSNQTTLSVRVYQLSALAGRGYPGVSALPAP